MPLRKKPPTPTVPHEPERTQKGAVRQRRSSATARAEQAAEFDFIHPHVFLDVFWQLHGGFSTAHSGIGSIMSYQIAAGHPDRPYEYHLVSRAERKDGGVEELHMHRLTAITLTITRRIKRMGQWRFDESTQVLPRSKRAVAAHLASV